MLALFVFATYLYIHINMKIAVDIITVWKCRLLDCHKKKGKNKQQKIAVSGCFSQYMRGNGNVSSQHITIFFKFF
jgi:hypothetical protein